jgi:hypothetical protein
MIYDTASFRVSLVYALFFRFSDIFLCPKQTKINGKLRQQKLPGF